MHLKWKKMHAKNAFPILRDVRAQISRDQISDDRLKLLQYMSTRRVRLFESDHEKNRMFKKTTVSLVFFSLSMLF